tara:strand:- start:4733 stop:5788 length:1056 start_codon:yes stop_codon:yes gene_type:complete
MKVDLYFGKRSSKIFGTNRVKIELYKGLPKEINKKAISYTTKNKYLNYFDFLTLAPLSTLKKKRKKAITHILSQSEAHLLHFFRFKKSVVLCYDIMPLLLPYTSSYARWKAMISYTGMRKANHIIVNAKSVKEEIVKHLKYPSSRITVAPLGVDKRYKPIKNLKAIREKYNLNKKDKYLIYVGNEEPRMNIDTILKALKLSKNKNLKLIKVGLDNYPGMREKTLKLVKKLNLEKDIIFTGYVPEEDLPYLYNIADIAIYIPSIAGFGLPPLESMACGTPTIGSNRSCIPEVIEKAGLLVNPRDPESLAENIKLILSNKQLAKDLSKKGQEQAKKFTWEKFIEQTVQVYKNL